MSLGISWDYCKTLKSCTEKTLKDPELGTVGTEKTLRYPEVCTDVQREPQETRRSAMRVLRKP